MSSRLHTLMLGAALVAPMFVSAPAFAGPIEDKREELRDRADDLRDDHRNDIDNLRNSERDGRVMDARTDRARVLRDNEKLEKTEQRQQRLDHDEARIRQDLDVDVNK